MLILGRKVGQKIIINEDLIIKVVYVDYKYNYIKLGFDAAKEDYLIDRYEIFELKQNERGD